MNSDDIVQALERNHGDCMTMPEATIGSSFGAGSRMDFWAMKPTWSDTIKTWGYEIKVSRADFKSDKKWSRYVPYCSRFYFITPWEMVQPNEIESPAGLCWVDNEGIIHVKKRAKVREVEQEKLFTMLMRWCFKKQFALQGDSYKKLYEDVSFVNRELWNRIDKLKALTPAQPDGD